MPATETHAAIDAVWRIESAKLIGALVRIVRDISLAEELAQDALVAGFWLWEVKSMAEAVEWAKRCPNPMPGDSDLEIRPFFEAEDLGPEFTPELRAKSEELRRQIEKGK